MELRTAIVDWVGRQTRESVAVEKMTWRAGETASRHSMFEKPISGVSEQRMYRLGPTRRRRLIKRSKIVEIGDKV